VSFFARTALLITVTLAVFSVIAWAAIAWSTIIPGAELAGHVLAQRADAAMTAYLAHAAIPADVEVESAAVTPPHVRSLDNYSLYFTHLRTQLLADLPRAQVVIARTIMPTEVWVRGEQIPDRWFVVRWRAARPGAPLALFAVVLAAALLVLGAAAIFARRMTAPLAQLVAATGRVAVGEPVTVDTNSGPREVRSLALAFQAMSNRLADLDEQRELMLAGLSHDLRSPLARVRVAVELLEGPNAALAAQMTEEIELLDRMIGQFMHYVRAGYQEQPAEACLDDIVRDTLARHTMVQMELGSPEPRRIAVESLRHILLNLVQNALEYGRPPVKVRTSGLRVKVEDCGVGLSPGEWSEAIQPFRRLRGTPGAGHTGLGLAMVDRLVRAAGGTLTATRTAGGFVVEVAL
jgi:two-component system, OmpR family, osmolarity sensor histidine kinase EnvZ